MKRGLSPTMELETRCGLRPFQKLEGRRGRSTLLERQSRRRVGHLQELKAGSG